MPTQNSKPINFYFVYFEVGRNIRCKTGNFKSFIVVCDVTPDAVNEITHTLMQLNYYSYKHKSPKKLPTYNPFQNVGSLQGSYAWKEGVNSLIINTHAYSTCTTIINVLLLWYGPTPISHIIVTNCQYLSLPTITSTNHLYSIHCWLSTIKTQSNLRVKQVFRFRLKLFFVKIKNKKLSSKWSSKCTMHPSRMEATRLKLSKIVWTYKNIL